jgi:hypothetical protein
MTTSIHFKNMGLLLFVWVNLTVFIDGIIGLVNYECFFRMCSRASGLHSGTVFQATAELLPPDISVGRQTVLVDFS